MSLEPERRQAIVWIPEEDFPKIAAGIILPNGYRLAPRLPFTSTDRQAIGFIVEAAEIPPTGPGRVLPSLNVSAGYDAIIVLPWGTT